ncbi:MAG: hypothetical protein QOH13_2422 [Thermoleophilaceae bacterium]|nr:hypothetical protein [Thermoleophilaceae bacterium]
MYMPVMGVTGWTFARIVLSLAALLELWGDVRQGYSAARRISASFSRRGSCLIRHSSLSAAERSAAGTTSAYSTGRRRRV